MTNAMLSRFEREGMLSMDAAELQAAIDRADLITMPENKKKHTAAKLILIGFLSGFALACFVVAYLFTL